MCVLEPSFEALAGRPQTLHAAKRRYEQRPVDGQGMREALFGGGGYVPDIPWLQAWLESAWRRGFDTQGSDQLGGGVQGTHAWIGTTEAAALLRQFGLRARVVDFQSARARAQQPWSARECSHLCAHG